MSLVFAILILGQTTVRDGSFSDPSIWSAPVSPGSDVTIRHNITLTQDAKVRTITVAAEGSLTVSGSPTVTFTDSPINTQDDPEQLGHGLVVYGRLRVRGARVEPYARVGADLVAGTAFVPMDAVPNSWEPGQTLYVPDTRQPDYPQTPTSRPLHEEFRTIRQVQRDGVLLDAPLEHSHAGARDADGRLRYLPVIANLSRSITFRSENPRGTRAHAIFMDRADISIDGAAFLDMGRTTNERIDKTVRDASGNVIHVGKNQLGRYAVHWHHCHGPEPDPTREAQFRIADCVVWSQEPLSRWGITVHHSHFGIVEDNVVICCAGSGIVTEDGNETGNYFARNYVAHVTGDSRPDARTGEIGFEGACYWFRGPNNSVVGNHAYGAQLGYTYYPRFAPTSFRYPTVPGGPETEKNEPCKIPILEFRDNEACACQTGFSPWWVGAIDRSPVPEIGESLIDNLACWHTRGGVSAYECGRFVYRNFVAIGDKRFSGDSNGGWGASDYIQWRVRIEGGNIENYNSGIRAPSIADKLGAYGTNPGLFVVRGTRVRCRNNITVPIPWHNAKADRLPPLLVHLDGCNLQPLVSGSDQKHLRLGLRQSDFSNYSQWSLTALRGPYVGGPMLLRWFGPNQNPPAILPASSPDLRVVGAPVAMPNREAWPMYGVTSGGEFTPAGAFTNPLYVASYVFGRVEPYIRPIPDATIQPGQTCEYGVCAYDPTLGDLEYSVDGPAGMAIENRSGKLNWVAPMAEGIFPVTVRARDVDDGTESRRSFFVTVRMPSG